MFEQDLSATQLSENNPLSEVVLQASDVEWQECGDLLDQKTDVAKDLRSGTNPSMNDVSIAVDGAQLFESEQSVTYPNGSVQQENVYWDTGLQIHYWECQTDGEWYFEDPYNDDAITKAGSYKKLLSQLEHRKFWWLEMDEDVSVTKNFDGSKCYAYKGLDDPEQITVLLEKEAEQADIAAEQPVSKWKAVALSAMTLLGNATGFQSLVKSYVSGPGPNQSELPTVDKPADRKQWLSANSSAKYKQSEHTESAYGLGQYPFSNVEYQPRAIVSALQFFSVMATGVASIIHPRFGREHSMLGFSKLLTLLTSVQSSDGYMIVEADKKSLPSKQKEDFPETETFTHVFDMPTLTADLSLSITKPVIYSNQGVQLSPQPTTVVDNSLITSYGQSGPSNSAIAISLGTPTLLHIPVVHLPEQAELRQANKPRDKTIGPLEEQPASLSLSRQLREVNVQSRQSFVPSPAFPTGFNTISDVIETVDHASRELGQYIRAVEEKVIANDEKGAKEKAHGVQLLDNLALALSKTSELLRRAEKSSNDIIDTAISHQRKILEDTLADVGAYFTTKISDSSSKGISDLKKTPTSDMDFLSTVSAAMADVDSETLGIGIVLGVVGSVVVGIGAYMIWRKWREKDYRTMIEEGSRVSPFTSNAAEILNLQEFPANLEEYMKLQVNKKMTSIDMEGKIKSIVEIFIKMLTDAVNTKKGAANTKSKDAISVLEEKLDRLRPESQFYKPFFDKILNAILITNTSEYKKELREIYKSIDLEFHQNSRVIQAMLSVRLLLGIEIPEASIETTEGTKIKIRAIDRMYVPQRYMGFYWNDFSVRKDSVKYLATHGAATCIVVSMSVLSASDSSRLTMITHLDGTHNHLKLPNYFGDVFRITQEKFKTKFSTYFGDIIKIIREKFKTKLSTPSIVVNVIFGSAVHSESYDHGADIPNHLLQNSVYSTLKVLAKEYNIKPRMNFYHLDATVNAAVSIDSGDVYTYLGNEFELDRLSDKENFLYSLNVGNQNSALYYLKDIGGLCRIGENFNLIKSGGFFFYDCDRYDADLARFHNKQKKMSAPQELCFSWDQRPTVVADLNQFEENPELKKCKALSAN